MRSFNTKYLGYLNYNFSKNSSTFITGETINGESIKAEDVIIGESIKGEDVIIGDKFDLLLLFIKLFLVGDVNIIELCGL